MVRRTTRKRTGSTSLPEFELDAHSTPDSHLEQPESRGEIEEQQAQSPDDLERKKSQINLPAHLTKHLPNLEYHFKRLDSSFSLQQSNTSGSTGSSLWLSSQVLSSYLTSIYLPCLLRSSRCALPSSVEEERPRAIELGSGTGLVSLLLARLGFEVLATDVEPPLGTVLRPNVEQGRHSLEKATARGQSCGSIQVSHLDWCVEFESWHWDDHGPSTDSNQGGSDAERSKREGADPKTPISKPKPYDLIFTADTVYEARLIRPLFRSIKYLYESSVIHTEGGKLKRPKLLIALERRDSGMVDLALRVARDEFGFSLKQVTERRVRKAVDGFGDGKSWDREDWSGVEIWQGELP
ncbi:hypothetical protein IE53DRAFT_330737 [Violaceomyces palustris]|uniref:Uncharacterized protein n=1 Tax=Violaceomyces palustris TaxID=1673888 RepID=A0ACD0NWI4_9BASI|nr:hypothetical protein IE53DRAFT_330737 [Violaceomyces palustris]